MKKLISILAATVLFSRVAFATNYTWDGDIDSDWGEATNWVGDVVPVFADTNGLVFCNAGASNLTTYLNVSRIIGSLEYTADATNVVGIRLDNGATTARTLTLGSASVAPTILVTSSGVNITHVIGSTGRGSVVMANDLTITVNAAPTSDTRLLFNRGISGAYNITKEGTGQLYLGVANGYTGKMIVNVGRLRIDDSTALGNNPASFVADRLTLKNGTSLYGNGVSTTFGNRGITLDSGTATFLCNNSAGTMAVDAVITGAGGLTIGNFNVAAGTSTYTLSGASTYTGATTMTKVTFAGGSTVLIISPTGSILSSGTITVNSNTTMRVQNTVDALKNNAVVNINRGGVMDLTNGVNDTIGSLFLDGVQQTVVGTYGSTNSPATYTSAYFTGKGMLNVGGNMTVIVPAEINKLFERNQI